MKSCRTGNFSLYCETLERPLVAALNHPNYFRILPVHLKDMATLERRFPSFHAEFAAGKFVGQKTDRRFSMIPLDQVHEQLNDYIKNESGVIGNLDDPRTVRREQVARPEMARLIFEIEGQTVDDSEKHHDQYFKAQTDFQVSIIRFVNTFMKSCNKHFCSILQSDVKKLVEAFEELDNPFCDESGRLRDMNSCTIMSDEVVENIKGITSIGEEKYKSYLEDRILSSKTPFMAPLKQSNLKLLSSKPSATKVKNPRQERDSGVTNFTCSQCRARNSTCFFCTGSDAASPFLNPKWTNVSWL
jgi:hypothetical protein